MEGSVSNVQFSERKRGFDPDEVANYLAHIDEKIAGLRSIAAEAIERAEHAEERARVAEQRVATAEEGPAQAAGVLAMAQQTADATVSQARAEADALLDAARHDADRHRLSAEAEAQQLLADTRRDLETRRSEHLETLRAEIDGLVAVRDAVAADIDALEAHLADQRRRVIEARDALSQVADDPAALGAADVPQTVAVASWDDADAAPFATTTADADAGSVMVDEVIVEDVVVIDADSGEVVAEAIVEDVVVSDAATGEVLAEGVVVEAASADPADLPWGGSDPGATAAVAAVGGLFDDDAVDEPTGETPGGEAGGIFDAEAPADSAFGAFGEEEDEAMRAFFEGDVEGDERPGRWGFRRR